MSLTRLSRLRAGVGSVFWLEALVLGIGALAFFLYGISQIVDVVFDESYYVAAAKAFLTNYPPKNIEHPPLGKLLIALGMDMFGENSFGWRFMSALFGALSLAAVHAISRNIFAERRTAWICTALTLFNGILYVQSRIAMLDIFMLGFMLGAILAAVLFLKNPRKISLLAISGALGGCAVASKEFAVIPFAVLAAIIGVSLVSKTEWKIKKIVGALTIFIVIGFVFYMATFIPYLFSPRYKGRAIWDVLITLQFAIFKYQLLEVRAKYDHPYASQWWEWVLSLRPIWYHYSRMPYDPSYARGILMLGNPIVMVPGVLAVLYCAKSIISRKNGALLGIVTFYSALTLCWPLLARKEAYYFYYLPAAMVLGFALAYFLERLRYILIRRNFLLRNSDLLFVLASAIIFAYFYPVFSGAIIPDSDFFKWMWLESWI